MQYATRHGRSRPLISGVHARRNEIRTSRDTALHSYLKPAPNISRNCDGVGHVRCLPVRHRGSKVNAAQNSLQNSPCEQKVVADAVNRSSVGAIAQLRCLHERCTVVCVCDIIACIYEEKRCCIDRIGRSQSDLSQWESVV